MFTSTSLSERSRIERWKSKGKLPPSSTSVIFYRERQDAPVHAKLARRLTTIAAEVWQSDKGKVLMVQPMHCLGLSPAQVVEVMVEILKACSSELGVEITKFANKVELHPSQCPILDCPRCHNN